MAVLYMLWFNFILGLNFISLCFKLIIIHYHTQKQREIKFKPRIKLNHNICNKRFAKIRNPDSVKLQKCTAVRGLAVSQEKK